MEELLIEEKAKRYDEAIKRANSLLSGNQLGNAWIYELLPELKESEGERIRKWLIRTLKSLNNSPVQIDGAYEMMLPAIAWVEKQGEQKPADKVEPKFKVGDWVVYCNDDVDLITGIEENGYCINNGGYIPFVCASDVRLWTIQDANDGDVISWDDSKCIAIFKKNIYDEDSFNSYGFVGGCTGTFESRMYYHDIEGAHPASKEQRDTLIKAMHEAGYEWDAEKKELKKIEHEPAEIEKGVKGNEREIPISVWSEEDKDYYDAIIAKLEVTQEDAALTDNQMNFLKSLRDRYTWKPSDEQMTALRRIKAAIAGEGDIYKPLNSLYQDLLKLMEK